MRLTLFKRQPETHDTERFYFKPEQKFEYTPGQFLRWILPHDHTDDRSAERFFTIASSPTEDLIMLCTKFNTERSSTFKTRLKAMEIGQALEIKGPMGSFVLPENANLPVTFVASGIGITPYRSILKFLYDTHQSRPVTLLYGARSNQDFAFRPELALWAPTIEADVSYFTEKLTPEEIFNASKNSIIYLSGPQPVAEELKQGLLGLGVELGRIKTDFFPGYSQI